MTGKRAVRLGTVQETLLIPLYGRAVETRKDRGLLRDPQAVAMVDAIEYDFARFDGTRSLLGTTLRTCVVDTWVRDFVAEHPGGTVVEIGAGLNTRFERVDNGRVHWVDLDLPDVIELRRRFFAESDRRHMIPASVLEPSWIDAVLTNPGPYFIVAEAVLIYLDEPAVERALGLIAEHFPGARIALDTVGGWIIAHQHRHDTLKSMQAKMTWACDDPHELERWGLHVLQARDLSQLPVPLRRALPVTKRAMLTAAHFLARQRFARYKINLLEIAR